MSTMEDWRWATVAPDRLADYPPHFTTEVLTLDIRWGGGGDDHYGRLELVYCCCIATNQLAIRWTPMSANTFHNGSTKPRHERRHPLW